MGTELRNVRESVIDIKQDKPQNISKKEARKQANQLVKEGNPYQAVKVLEAAGLFKKIPSK